MHKRRIFKNNGESMNIKLKLLLLSAIVLGATYNAQAGDNKRKRDQFESDLDVLEEYDNEFLSDSDNSIALETEQEANKFLAKKNKKLKTELAQSKIHGATMEMQINVQKAVATNVIFGNMLLGAQQSSMLASISSDVTRTKHVLSEQQKKIFSLTKDINKLTAQNSLLHSKIEDLEEQHALDQTHLEEIEEMYYKVSAEKETAEHLLAQTKKAQEKTESAYSEMYA